MSQTVWRITTARFAQSAFSGEGARLYGGRWNPKGSPMVYTAQSQSLALLEMAVQDAPLRAHYVLIPAHLPANLSTQKLGVSQLPDDWRKPSGLAALLALGRKWLSDRRSCAWVVPSAVLPGECNWLLNPEHPDFQRIRIGPPQALEVDARLLRNFGSAA